ncbi:Hpt domain-containing protein [Oleidesulfovibrio sp.]|uniref:Hpt domain-containing protein n=1 Tax=Oleidesulfovibrio sp. TaxID=2909707 RepID=UPI003A85D2C7
MSQDFMDPEIFADFILEAKEHLETIEPNLLELENSPDNLSLLNEIFRPMHSLKGASGFLGLNRINSLAHRAENILDELRKGEMAVSAEIMDVILSATDALRQMIDNLDVTGQEGDVEIASIVEIIDQIMAGGGVPAAQPATPVEEDTSADSESTGEFAGGNVLVEAEPQEAEERVFQDQEAYVLTAFGEGHLRDFVEEAREISENLNSGLLELEKNPNAEGDLVNDLFRYFHNLKGNSGIIGYAELNSLTHEAETLLNRVRKGEMPSSHALVDLLLVVVDYIDAMVERIDTTSGKATPVVIEDVLARLQKAVSEGIIDAPVRAQATAPQEAKAAPPAAEQVAPAAAGEANGVDADDLNVFKDTIRQQFESIKIALEELSKDSSQKDYIDALFRSLVTIQNSCGYMGLEESKVYADRTSKLVDQARSTDLDFSLMTDLLEQECAILKDMVDGHVAALASPAPVADAPDTDSGSTPAQPQPPAGVKPAAAKKEEKAAPKAEKTAPPEKPASAAPKPTAPKAAPTAKPAAPPAEQPTAQKGKSSSTIRVDHEKLDHLMNLIGELIINRNRYTMLARRLEGETNVNVADVAQNLTETTYAMARISDDLQDTIMKVRMVPVSSVFSRFPRLVRDLSRKSGKEVELIMEGEETELDKSVVEVIGDPLVHLIRNAMDHGVEPEEERIAKGKRAKGRVCLRAYHKGNSVAIEIEDDGKGIDPEKMREVAIKKGIISPEEAKALDDREAMELIFAPGFSSAETITDISGRGVGMDVVRTNIKNLKGSVSIQSEIGKGTKFILSLPLTLAIIDALMVNVSGETYAIPLDAVSETTKIEAERLTDVNHRKAVTLRGEVLGIVTLSELLGLESTTDDDEVLSVVVIHDNDRRLGLVVDRLLERQEIVIKPMGEYLGDLRGISGATIMGDGSVVLILDPHEVYLMATSKAM